MTVEGDRSGTSTPSRREKSKNLIDATMLMLARLQAEWDSLDRVQIDDRIAEVEANLHKAGIHISLHEE